MTPVAQVIIAINGEQHETSLQFNETLLRLFRLFATVGAG